MTRTAGMATTRRTVTTHITELDTRVSAAVSAPNFGPQTQNRPPTMDGAPVSGKADVAQRRFKRISSERMFQNRIRMPMVIM